MNNNTMTATPATTGRVTVDAAALAGAVEALVCAAHTDGACGGGRSEATDAAIDAVFALALATPPPVADAGGDAFGAAVDAYHDAAYAHGASGADFGDVVDACSAARAAVLHLHAAAVNAAEQGAWHAGLDAGREQGYAKGYAAALAEVTGAITSLAVGAWNGSVSVSCHGTPPELRWSAGSSKTRATDDLVRMTPIAAILAAAAALTPADDAGAGGGE